MKQAFCSDEPADQQIQQWADSIRCSNLAGPAIFVLELVKPLGFVAGTLLWIADPIVQSLTGHSSRQYALFLEDGQRIERLIATLEGRSLEPPA